MSHRSSVATIFSQVDISTAASGPQGYLTPQEEQAQLLRQVLTAQDRTNELLEELIHTVSSVQRQRNAELNNWKTKNPHLARSCRDAAEALSKVQVEYLDRLTEEVNESRDDLIYGDFLLSEFIDKYGPRLAHLNGVIQVLAQLSSTQNPTNQQQRS
jgi:hypothetical protein